MNKVRQMLVDLEQDLRAKKQYSAADNLLPIIEKATKQDWTPCSDHNPEESGYYLVFYYYGAQSVVKYSKRHDAWNASDLSDHKDFEIKDVIAWRALPEDFVLPEQEVICHEN